MPILPLATPTAGARKGGVAEGAEFQKRRRHMLFTRWIDENGNRRMAPALRASLDPRQWRALVTLANRFRVAGRVLDRLARALAMPHLLGGGAQLRAET